MPRKSTKKSEPGAPHQLAAPATGDPLREHLLKVYETRPRASMYTGPKPPLRIADHRDSGDPWEWRISLGILDTHPPHLVLAIYAIAVNPALVTFVQGLGGTVTPAQVNASLLVPLPPSDTASLKELAGKIRAVPSEKWPWLSGRVADALTRLVTHLDQYRPPA
jgi:hypothetical protein